MTYYLSEDGNPGRPMNLGEAVEHYRQMSDEEPTILADLYVDFHDFSRIEFLIFKDRLSSAILVSNSAKKSLTELESKFEAKRKGGAHLIPGWEGESDMALDESLHVTKDSFGISIGATIVKAAAALEGLLIDLTPDDAPTARGLARLLKAFLQRYEVPEDEAQYLTQMGWEIGKRRNTFAHSLTGSYWETDKSIGAMFTPEAMDDTLYAVGRIGVLLEGIVLQAETMGAENEE